MNALKKLAGCLLAATMLFTLAACGGGSGSSGGKTSLTMLTWDKNQTPGMEALAAAYMAQNPDVTVEVQSTSWDEYWTKLEAAATGNTMPDIFWMHTNEILKYTEGGILADLSDLYAEESPTYYTDHFSAISLDNARGHDGNIYGVPKDKDTVGLVYNMEMFDAANVAYPDANWTWDDLMEASRAIYDATGKYGYMAYADDQLGYWNFVYQAGGYILNEDGTKAGFTDPATQYAMEFYIGIQNEDFCPDQTYFAETTPGTAFSSGQGAMFIEGCWNIKSTLDQFPEMVGKWDIAVLPACPDPASGSGRASISNGLCYSTAANGKNLDAAKDFLRFLGTEEAMIIQGESGAAIPAYLGTEESFFTAFDGYDYRVNIEAYYEMFDYGVQSVNNPSRPEWKPRVNDELLKIYAGEQTVQEGLAKMQEIVDNASA